LERAAAFITHGAGGGLREGGWHGVPMLAVPQTYEQEILSANLAAQGAGVMLMPAEVTPANLRTGVQRLLAETSFRERGAALAVASREAGGATRAADAILRFAEGG
jgi:UDP:flavonoid glycosyltransferase YjiC (YdhE family)